MIKKLLCFESTKRCLLHVKELHLLQEKSHTNKTAQDYCQQNVPSKQLFKNKQNTSFIFYHIFMSMSEPFFKYTVSNA